VPTIGVQSHPSYPETHMQKLKLRIEDLAVKSFDVDESPRSRGTVIGNVVNCDGETDPVVIGPGPSGDSWHDCGTGYNCTAVGTCTGCVGYTGAVYVFTPACTPVCTQGC